MLIIGKKSALGLVSGLDVERLSSKAGGEIGALLEVGKQLLYLTE